MKRILLSLAIMVGATGIALTGSTGAFFSDTETSSGNTFAAGAIDLKIDNHSYYNGNECKEITAGIYHWVGTAPFPVPDTPCTTSWNLDDLNHGEITLHKFFDFSDIKPSDYSEDTISLHVDTNDSYLCANVKLTSNEENNINEPEATDGDVTSGPGEGELANNVNFIWWADDGDNVLEQGENVISSGPIGAIGAVGNSVDVPLADSGVNIWNPGNTGGPVTGGQTKYIGKAWCFGAISSSPVPQDGSGNTISPAGNNNGDQLSGTPEDGGYHCNGSLLDNKTQTDSLTADVTFTAVQSRNNARFQCVKSTTLTLVKNVDNTGGGTASSTQWTLNATGPTNISGVTGNAAVTNAVVNPGSYNLSETGGPSGYTAGTWSCSINGDTPVSGNSVSLQSGDHVVCTIINVFQPAHLTIIKVVNNTHGGNNVVSDFQLFAVGSGGATGFTSSVQQVIAPGSYFVTEDGVGGYQASFSGDCDVAGNVTLAAGQTKVCTITNNDIAPNITLHKIVTGTGPLLPAISFQLKIDGSIVPQNTSVAVTSNSAHSIDENAVAGYSWVSTTGSAKCPAVLAGTATLDEGEAITCNITNHKNI